MRKPKKPGAPKQRKELSSDEIKERRSLAFFHLEAPLRECSERAEIAAILIGQGRSDLADDIVYEIQEMLETMRADYRKAATIYADLG
jgi:hypothetical protein